VSETLPVWMGREHCDACHLRTRIMLVELQQGWLAYLCRNCISSIAAKSAKALRRWKPLRRLGDRAEGQEGK